MRHPLIEAYSAPVPRYTSYPTAPHFNESVTPAVFSGWLAALPPDRPVSLYLHIPYCDRMCWFCGCHTKQVRQYAPIAAYLDSLLAEIALVSSHIGHRLTASAIHLGGGSPTMLAPADLKRLMDALGAHFTITPETEISIEIDPNDIDQPKLDAIAASGINRASLGVQDFNPTVQAAINRIQTFGQTRAVVDGLRERGIDAINIDFLYGLPYQIVESVIDTARQVVELDPRRIALFGYAHVPWMKKHQRLINEAVLPDAGERFEQAQAAAAVLVGNGFEPIGMDHFARPADPLAIAARTGTLHRNFQGYTTDDAQTLIGLGGSSISQLPQGYAQNTVATGNHMRAIETGEFSIARGVALTAADRLHAYAIERIMCDFALSRADLSARFGANASAIFKRADRYLASHTDGLFTRDGDTYRVTPRGRPLVRHIAAIFDAYLETGTARHSMAV